MSTNTAVAAPLTPSDIPGLFECLKGALSADPAIQRSAEATLQSQESRTGFCSCLAEIFGSKQADHSAKWLAAVHLKNSINKYWKARPDQRNLSDDEKNHLRGKLLGLISQENNQIAVQIAVVFAKVARYDFPRQWPSLIEDLLSKLTGADTLTVRRVYLVLHHTLKELASKRLKDDQQNFASVTAKLFDHIWTQWCGDMQIILAGLPASLQAPGQAQPLLLHFERWLVLLKILLRLVLFGFPSDVRELQQVPAVAQVLQGALQALQALLSMRPTGSMAPRTQLHAMLDRGLLKLTKTITKVQEVHPWSTLHSGVFTAMLEWACTQLVEAAPGGGPAPDGLYIQCMLLIHNVLRCAPYRGSSGVLELGTRQSRQQVDTVKAMAAEAQRVLTAFWSGGRAQQLITALVHNFFPLSARELEEWAANPEEFHHAADNMGTWQENLRPCAEVLFKDLLESNGDELPPVVVNMLMTASAACPPGAAAAAPRSTPPSHLLAKEAAYNAAGVGAFELHELLDFTPWLRTTLLPELVDVTPAAKPLRRRAALLLGQWVPKLKKDDRPAVYRALLDILAVEDAALQLAAASSLHALVDDWDFAEDQFLEFVNPCFSLLTALLKSSVNFDSQLQVFNLINLIIDRLAENIKPYADGILRLLPDVWREAEGQSLLRIQALLALQRMVNVLGTESPGIYPWLLPILQYCTDINQPDELNLLEDGLALWLVALRNAPHAHPQLLNLFPHLSAVMQRSTEHVQVACAIMTSCTLLGGVEFLQQHGPALVHILCSLIGQVNEKGMLLVLPVIETVLQAQPGGPGIALLEPALHKLLAALLGGAETGLVVSSAMSILARALLQNTASFLGLLSRAAAAAPSSAPTSAGSTACAPGEAGRSTPPPGGEGGPALLLALLDLWLDRFDAIGAPAARKLSALALCVVLTLPVAGVLERLPLLAACITAVWFEVEGWGEPERVHFGYDYYTVLRSTEDGADMAGLPVNSEEAEGETNRRRRLYEGDPVNTLKLSAFLRDQLARAEAVHGPALRAALQRLEPALAQQLQGALAA